MKALGEYIHSKGLKYGMYTAMGTTTCQGYPAFGCTAVDSCTQAHADVQTYLSWGIDYIKVDSCGGSVAANFNTTHPLISSWFLEGGKASGRPVLYHPSGCMLSAGAGHGKQNSPRQYRLFSSTANMWRTYKDMQPVWSEVNDIIEFWAADTQAGHPTDYSEEWRDFHEASRPGVVQDPDALLVGNVANAASCRACKGRKPAAQFCPDRDQPDVPCMCCGTLTATEEQTNMVMWALWAAPLEIAADIRSIPNASAAVLLNREVRVLAVAPALPSQLLGRTALQDKPDVPCACSAPALPLPPRLRASVFCHAAAVAVHCLLHHRCTLQVIAVNQDPLVYQGRRVSNVGGLQVWRKPLADGSVAVVLFNSNSAPAPVPLLFQAVGFASCDRVSVRDVINHRELGVHIGGLAMNDSIPSHGVALLNLTAVW